MAKDYKCAFSGQEMDAAIRSYLNGGTSGKGEKGDKGDPGQKGTDGKNGIDGKAGERGYTGSKGDQGIQGNQGLKGDQGLKGEKGEDGKNGSGSLTDRQQQLINNWSDNYYLYLGNDANNPIELDWKIIKKDSCLYFYKYIAGTWKEYQKIGASVQMDVLILKGLWSQIYDLDNKGKKFNIWRKGSTPNSNVLGSTQKSMFLLSDSKRGVSTSWQGKEITLEVNKGDEYLKFETSTLKYQYESEADFEIIRMLTTTYKDTKTRLTVWDITEGSEEENIVLIYESMGRDDFYLYGGNILIGVEGNTVGELNVEFNDRIFLIKGRIYLFEAECRKNDCGFIGLDNVPNIIFKGFESVDSPIVTEDSLDSHLFKSVNLFNGARVYNSLGEDLICSNNTFKKATTVGNPTNETILISKTGARQATISKEMTLELGVDTKLIPVSKGEEDFYFVLLGFNVGTQIRNIQILTPCFLTLKVNTKTVVENLQLEEGLHNLVFERGIVLSDINNVSYKTTDSEGNTINGALLGYLPSYESDADNITSVKFELVYNTISSPVPLVTTTMLKDYLAKYPFADQRLDRVSDVEFNSLVANLINGKPYVPTENNYTTTEKQKLESIRDKFRGRFTSPNELPLPAINGDYAIIYDTIFLYENSWIDTGSKFGGDMLKIIYDPNGISKDSYNRQNHTGKQDYTTIAGLAEVASSGDFNTLNNIPELLTIKEAKSRDFFKAFNESGRYRMFKCDKNIPPGYTSDSDFWCDVYWTDDNFQKVIAYDVRSDKSFVVSKTGGLWGNWESTKTIVNNTINSTSETEALAAVQGFNLYKMFFEFQDDLNIEKLFDEKNGYIKIAGFIFQWTTINTTSSTGSVTWTYPKPFSKRCVGVHSQVCTGTASGSGVDVTYVYQLGDNTTQVSITHDYAKSANSSLQHYVCAYGY